MNKRLDLVKKIDVVLGVILESGNDFLKLAEEVEDKELQVKLVESVVILSYQVQQMNTFLIANITKYMNKDIDDEEFKAIMKWLEEKDGNK